MKKIVKGCFDNPEEKIQELINKLTMMKELYNKYQSVITRAEAVDYTIAQIREIFELEIKDGD